MRNRLAVGLTSVLLAMPTMAVAESKIDYSAELIASYSEADKRIQVGNKFATFRAGGAGFRIEAEHDKYGMLYGSLGFGYSPNETASYSGSSLSGPASSFFYGAGYRYGHQLNHRYKLIFSTDLVVHDITGDLNGDVRGLPAVAEITSDISMQDMTLALRYSISRDLHVSFGTGTRNWKLDALADGTIGGEIAATSQFTVEGRDQLQYIGFEFGISNVPVEVYYRRSGLNADNSVSVHEIEIQVLFTNF